MEEKIIVSDSQPQLPKHPPVEPVKVSVNESKEAVLLMIYILYKGNLVSRNNLRELIQVMEKPAPNEGVAKYLVNEAARS